MELFQGNASKEEGYNLLQTGQYEEAIDALKKAILMDPGDHQIHTFLGVAYNKKGDKMRSIASFEESLRLNESARSYYNLAMIYESVHRYDEAVREYQMAIDIDPNYTRAKEALDKLHAQFEATHPKPEIIEDVPAESEQEISEQEHLVEAKKHNITDSFKGIFAGRAKKA